MDLGVCIKKGLGLAHIKKRTRAIRYDEDLGVAGASRNPAAVPYYVRNTNDFFANSPLAEVNWFEFVRKDLLVAAKKTEAFFNQTK